MMGSMTLVAACLSRWHDITYEYRLQGHLEILHFHVICSQALFLVGQLSASVLLMDTNTLHTLEEIVLAH